MNGPSFTRKKILPAAVALLLILMFPLSEKLRIATAATYRCPHLSRHLLSLVLQVLITLSVLRCTTTCWEEVKSANWVEVILFFFGTILRESSRIVAALLSWELQHTTTLLYSVVLLWRVAHFERFFECEPLLKFAVDQICPSWIPARFSGHSCSALLLFY